MKKIFKNGLFYFVALILTAGNSFVSIFFDFGTNIAQAEEAISETIAVCDHNGDGLRTLTDVGIKAEFADTFDANHDGVHNSADDDLYAANYGDDSFCQNDFRFIAEPITPPTDTLIICDHNGDGLRTLADVGIFASCVNTFDADKNGVHDDADDSFYATHYAEAEFCQNNFKCVAEPVVPESNSTGSGSGGGSNPPDISDVLDNISCQNTQISWHTSKDSLTRITYGETISLGSEYKDTDYKSSHLVTLDSLKLGTSYYYVIHSQGQDGMSAMDSMKLFTTPSAEVCGEVLGEQIEEENPPLPQVLGDKEYVCDFVRPGNSQGVDADIAGVFSFPDGTLIRHECDPEMKVYIIREQMKWHIPNLNYLGKYYLGKRIYNVDPRVLEIYKDWTGKVSGVKEYPDGSLLRSKDMKIYVIENGKKVYISNLEELKKYAGQDIFNVSDEVINQY